MQFTLMGGIGDQLCASPVFRELKKRMPDENIRVFEAYHPELWVNNPYMRHGKRENGVRMHLDSPGADERIAQHYATKIAQKLAWVEPFIIEDDTPELFLTQAEIDAAPSIPPERTVAINAAAGWKTRRWPYFRELAAMLLRQGWSVYDVGYDGTPAIPCTYNFRGKMTVRQTAALLKKMQRVVCNDSGLMHLAAAVGTTQVVTFGHIPADERVYKTTRSPGGDRQCRKECKYTQCRFSITRCQKLDQITVREVFAEVVR